MNLWWFLFVPLSCLWVLPMFGANAANTPWFFFVAVAILWIVVLVFVQPLYDWGTNLLRKTGHDRMANFREGLKPKVLPPVRIALLIMVLISIVFAVI